MKHEDDLFQRIQLVLSAKGEWMAIKEIAQELGLNVMFASGFLRAMTHQGLVLHMEKGVVQLYKAMPLPPAEQASPEGSNCMETDSNDLVDNCLDEEALRTLAKARGWLERTTNEKLTASETIRRLVIDFATHYTKAEQHPGGRLWDWPTTQ